MALARQLRENPKVRLDTSKPTEAPKPAAQPAAETQPAVEATPAPAEAATPEAETPETETPAQEETAPAETTAEETTEPEETEDSGEGPVTPITGKRAHLRLNEADEVGRLALAYQKRNRDWTLSQALEAAQRQLGVTPAKTEAAQPEAIEQAPKLPQSTKEADALISQTLADYKKAMTEVRFEDAADLQAKLIELQTHRTELVRNAERQQAQAEQNYHKEFDASHAKAVDMYPFAADPKSPGGKRMAEIDTILKQNGDPLFDHPNKPLKLAQMVAAELNIAPRNKNAAPAKPAAAPAPAQPKKGILPTGGSRTTPPPAAEKPAIQQQIQAVKSVHDLRKVLRSVGVPT